jgi:uncharacterized protein
LIVFLKRAAFVIFVSIGVLFLLAYFLQRAFLFPAPTSYQANAPVGYELVQTFTTDGLLLKAAYRPALDGKPVLVFFHGNGDSFSGADAATRHLVEIGYGALLVEYRGYAGNPGSPSEAGLYRDGEAAIKWLSAKAVPTKNVVLIGNSMGSGVATEMAVRHPVKALILVSGFSSLPEVVSGLYPLLPAGILIRDKFNSASKLGKVTAPILILHGTADRLVLPVNAERLKYANLKADLKTIPHIGHELAYLPQTQATIAQWISNLRR